MNAAVVARAFVGALGRRSQAARSVHQHRLRGSRSHANFICSAVAAKMSDKVEKIQGPSWSLAEEYVDIHAPELANDLSCIENGAAALEEKCTRLSVDKPDSNSIDLLVVRPNWMLFNKYVINYL